MKYSEYGIISNSQLSALHRTTMMKLVLLLSLFFTVYASAGTKAQNVTINFNSVELKKAIEETQVADQYSISV